MELALLQLAIRVLDPRRWRQRLRQLGGLLLGVGWLWFRSVNRADVVRAVADQRHEQRAARIRERNVARERARLAP